jgi:hypothetical protein
VVDEAETDGPCRITEEFAIYLNYVRKLGFTETPDYNFLRDLFSKALRFAGETEDGVYDWMLLNQGKGWQSASVSNFVLSRIPTCTPRCGQVFLFLPFHSPTHPLPNSISYRPVVCTSDQKIHLLHLLVLPFFLWLAGFTFRWNWLIDDS